MFDLEQAIGKWRKSMSARLPFQGDTVAELESHLRDAVQKHQQSGLAPAEAWTAALKQLGDPDLIAREFGKLPGRSIWNWLPAQVVLGTYAALAVLVAFAASRGFANRGDAILAIHVWSITVGYLAVFAVGAIAISSILSRAMWGWTSTETDVFIRTTRFVAATALTLIVMGVVLGGVWLRRASGQFWVVDLREIGGITLAAWTLFVVLLRHRMRDERLAMRLGLAGNAIVAACWFGPAFLAIPAAHGFGSVSLATTALISGFTVSTLFLGGLTFLRPGRLRFR